jgi:transcriptional regulator with XRE-family HTH domain
MFWNHKHMTNIGKRAKERREELGLSQTQVGDACGVTQQAIEKLEAGEVRRPRYLDDLADKLLTTKKWLQDGTGQKGIIKFPDDNDNHSVDTLMSLWQRSTAQVQTMFLAGIDAELKKSITNGVHNSDPNPSHGKRHT